MVFDELLGLNEHAARAAAGVIDAALIGFEHFDKRADNGAGREELAAALAFGAGKARDEVFIDPAQQVARAVGAVVQLDVGEEVHQLAQHGLVERGAGIILGQDALEGFVGGLGLYCLHRFVDDLADILRAGVSLNVGPAGRFGHPEDILGEVFLGVLGIGEIVLCELIVHRLEGFGNVFEEDQPQRDVFVLGRLQPAAHLVGCLEQIGCKVEVCPSGIGHEMIAPDFSYLSESHSLLRVRCRTGINFQWS